VVTQWTSRAWSDSHADSFTHNLITLGDGIGGESAEARDYLAFTPNNARPTWPTLDEVLRWGAQNSYPGTPSPLPVEIYQLCLDASVENLAGRCHLLVRPVDANDAVDPLGDPVEIPAAIKLGTTMQAVHWARRQNTPDGIAGTSEITGLLRVASLDPDVERLVFPHLVFGLA
jgi:hypothetical protein